jgi:hypothetical protein
MIIRKRCCQLFWQYVNGEISRAEFYNRLDDIEKGQEQLGL